MIIVKLSAVEYKITTFIYKFLIFVFWIDNRRCCKGILIWSCHIACRSSEIKPPENRCLLNSIHLLEKSSNYEELYRKNISFKIIRYFFVSHGNEIIQDKFYYQKLFEWIDPLIFVFWLFSCRGEGSWNSFCLINTFLMYMVCCNSISRCRISFETLLFYKYMYFQHTNLRTLSSNALLAIRVWLLCNYFYFILVNKWRA